MEGRAFVAGMKVLGVGLPLLFWEIVSRSEVVSPKLFPPPTIVLLAMYRDVISGLLFRDVLASISRAIVGFSIGSMLGIAFGIATGRSKTTYWVLGTLFNLVRPIPPISFVPLAVLWFGLGEGSKYSLVFVGVFFPVWLNTHIGIRGVPQQHTWVAETLGYSKLRTVIDVHLPAAAPMIVAGLRVAVAISFYCLVAAEIAGAFFGVAYRIEISHLFGRVDRMLGGMLVLGVLSTLADLALRTLVGRIAPWLRYGEDLNERTGP